MKIGIFCDPPVSKPGHNVGGCHAVVSHMTLQLQAQGHDVTVTTAAIFADPEAQKDPYGAISKVFEAGQFDQVHLQTPTRVGYLARRYCVEHGLQFTATYDTQIPEYLEMRFGIPASIAYSYLRWFYDAATVTVVPTPSLKHLVESWGMKRIVANAHGVDTELFKPLTESPMSNPETQKFFDSLPKPVLLYVGRITPEKSPQDFLKMDLGGRTHSKVLVGSICGGLTEEELKAIDPNAHFVGIKTGQDLADYYKGADCFVFTSRTDTFGLVILEAMAAGSPAVAYPVVGAVDVITDSKVGCLDNDLNVAVAKALTLSRDDCRKFALNQSWAASIGRFASHFTALKGDGPVGPDTQNVWNDMSWDDCVKVVDMAAMALWGNEPTYKNRTW